MSYLDTNKHRNIVENINWVLSEQSIVGDVASGDVFAFFWPPLPGPGRQSIEPYCWLTFCLETRPKSESLEPLNGFLAYLEPKPWIKKNC